MKSRNIGLIEDNETSQTNKGKLLKDEKLMRGSINKRVYFRFFKLGGCGNLFWLSVLIILYMGCKVVSDYWLGVWVKNDNSLTQNENLMIYGGLIVGIVFFGVFKSVVWGVFCSNIAYTNFNNLLLNILKKPMRYFDVTPLGQILNLSGKDTDTIDNYLLR